ncbi:MAG: sigma-70 family RNA polymerase sigma factor [Aquabacterium sp.]|nr:MAG: sigma-70 family RNA polymerase sigma factor [Aquabacterium sp.]
MFIAHLAPAPWRPLPPGRGAAKEGETTAGRSARVVALHRPPVQAAASDRLCTLLRAVADGDRAAFGELYDATSACLLGIACGVLGRQDLAEEALQDAYVKVWRHADRFDAGIAAPMTWLINIVRNRAIDIRRARQMELASTVALDDEAMRTLHETVPDASPGPEDLLLQAAAAQGLRGGLATLSSEQRQAVALVIYQGCTHAEIAARAGVPLSTAKTWVRRGLMRLKAELEAGPAAAKTAGQARRGAG